MLRNIMTTPAIPIWVHSLADYRLMFDLDDKALNKTILDYPAGISCFNAQWHAQGPNNVVSADPYYDLAPLDMMKHVDFVIQELSEKLDHYLHLLQPAGEKEIENLLNVWNQYAQIFLADYSDGQQEGRYRAAKLPTLPFKDQEFELGLCSNLLFRERHYSAETIVSELARVAQEVRIFPLLDQNGEIAKDLGPIMLLLQQKNFGVEVKTVPYTLMKKSNAMLRFWSKECVVL